MSKLIHMVETSQVHAEQLVALSRHLEKILDQLAPELHSNTQENEMAAEPIGLLNQLHSYQTDSIRTANHVKEQLSRLEDLLFGE